MAGDGNVITTLRDRWSLEQEIQAMLDTRSEQEFSAQAQRVATSGPQVVPVLLAQLDQAGSQYVGVLGVVASLYPDRQEIVDKLTQVAYDQTRPDRGRVSAILILEHFLEQELDPYLLDTLDNPRFMAVETIREMIREGAQNPRAWIEYTRSLIEQPPETIWDVMDTLLVIGGERAVPALCLLAQEEREIVSEAALHTLGRIDHPAAAEGLRSIVPLLPPVPRALAQRSLLKLQLKQILPGERPDPRGRWRTLVGPPDGHGYQVVWFFHAPNERGERKFLGLSLHEQAGIPQAYGNHRAAPELVPEPLPLGQVHQVLLPVRSEEGMTGARLLMLETDFAYGRRLVQEAQARTIEAGQRFPIEYRLMGPWLWHYAASEDAVPAPPAPARAASRPADLAASVGLLHHPAFRGWFVEGEWLLKPARALLAQAPGEQGLPPGEIDRLARHYCDSETAKRLQGRLRAMGEWLQRAGQMRPAAITWAAAQALDDTPPERHPLVRAMVELGLQVMVEQLRLL
jgi:hypothetical protein